MKLFTLKKYQIIFFLSSYFFLNFLILYEWWRILIEFVLIIAFLLIWCSFVTEKRFSLGWNSFWCLTDHFRKFLLHDSWGLKFTINWVLFFKLSVRWACHIRLRFFLINFIYFFFSVEFFRFFFLRFFLFRLLLIAQFFINRTFAYRLFLLIHNFLFCEIQTKNWFFGIFFD